MTKGLKSRYNKDIYNYFYLYNEKEKPEKCFFVARNPRGEIDVDSAEELKLVEIKESKELGVFKAVFSHADPDGQADELFLTIEKRSPKIIEITLSNVKWKTPIVNGPDNWLEVDWGKFIWNEEYSDYKLKKGLPKTFYGLYDDFDDNEDVQVSFYFKDHLVQKDKDEQKNYIWYQFDWTRRMGQYLYSLLSPYLDQSKEIYAIPAENSQALEAWAWDNEELEEWMVNDAFHGAHWPETKYNPNYDLSKHNRETWLEWETKPPALVISFLPTSSENWKLPVKQRMTGTKFFTELWEIFIKHGDPVVVKCYPDFLRQMQMRHPDWFAKLDKTVELPLQIGGKAMGTGNTLAFFNCPWIKNKTKEELSYRNWEDREWKRMEEDVIYLQKSAIKRFEKIEATSKPVND